MSRIRAEQLGKYYKHYPHASHRLWEWASGGRMTRHQSVWVLRNVSFEVEPGEAVGIVGENGAGKSTLLKLVKGTIRASAGRVETAGRIAALEIGLGFHPDFSGLDNLYTGGALIGLDGARVRALLPEIEDFAEIGAALHEPVRTYSTGMQLRLAFSLATAVRPDALLIDEALAVGDAYFQQKCMARIRGFRAQGTSLLLVSHDAGAIRSLCDRALLFEGGQVVREGSPAAVLEYYNARMAERSADYEIRQGAALAEAGSTRSGDGSATFERIELLDDRGPAGSFTVGSNMRIRLEGRAREPVESLTVGISLRDRLGNEIFGTNTHHLGGKALDLAAGGRFRAEFTLPVNLGCGHYGVTAALHSGAVHLDANYDWWDNVCVFEVLPGAEPPFVGSCHLAAEARVEHIESET